MFSTLSTSTPKKNASKPAELISISSLGEKSKEELIALVKDLSVENDNLKLKLATRVGDTLVNSDCNHDNNIQLYNASSSTQYFWKPATIKISI